MEKTEFYDAVINEIRGRIPEEIREDISIDIREVTKNNDVKLHGLTMLAPGQNLSPTVYLEEAYERYENGASISDVADGILSVYADSMINGPDLESLSFSYGDIEDKLYMHLVEVERNRDRLKEVVYRPLDNGMALIPYVSIPAEEGSYSLTVTKELAKAEGYDLEALMDKAMANTVENQEPAFRSLAGMLFGYDKELPANPLKEDFTLDSHEPMYVISNKEGDYGAIALFYPEVAKRIGEVIGSDYYALPSSTHEFIIMPDSPDVSLDALREMVKDANRTVVQPKDVLSDRVFKYERDKERLFVPEVREKANEERDGR